VSLWYYLKICYQGLSLDQQVPLSHSKGVDFKTAWRAFHR
jgi:hypothetical protein